MDEEDGNGIATCLWWLVFGLFGGILAALACAGFAWVQLIGR